MNQTLNRKRFILTDEERAEITEYHTGLCLFNNRMEARLVDAIEQGQHKFKTLLIENYTGIKK